MSHNQWESPADGSQHPAGPITFFNPTQFNHGSANAATMPAGMPGSFGDQGSNEGMQNPVNDAWQQSWNSQWNFEGNVVDQWPNVIAETNEPLQYQGEKEQQMAYQPGQLGTGDMQWADGAAGKGYDASGYNQTYNPYGGYTNTDAHYGPQDYGYYAPGSQQAGFQDFTSDGYNDQFFPSVPYAEGSGEQAIQSAQFQSVGVDDRNAERFQHFAAANVISNEVLPKVSSFETNLHQPSPFDELVGTATARAELTAKIDAVHSHSRNSSSGGGVHFLIGGSENTSECASNSDSPHGFVREQVSLKANALVDAEQVDSSVAAAEQIHVAENTTTPFIPPSSNIESVTPPPPKTLQLHSTMTGTPAVNQFRVRKTVNLPTRSEATAVRNEQLHDTMSAPISHSSNSDVGQASSLMSGYSMQDSGQSRNVDANEAIIRQNSVQPSGDLAVAGSVPSGATDHMMNIYSSPILPHKESSFTPVGSGSHHTALPAHKVSPHDAAPPAAVSERESSASESSHLDAEEIENDALLDNGHHNITYMQNSGAGDGRKEHPNVPSSPPKPTLENAGVHTHFSMHKARRETTMSPAATLWENPEPPSVQLAPAMAASTVDIKLPEVKPASSELMQNTGTGPSRSLTGFALLDSSLGSEVRASAVAVNDQQVSQTPERMVYHSFGPSADLQTVKESGVLVAAEHDHGSSSLMNVGPQLGGQQLLASPSQSVSADVSPLGPLKTVKTEQQGGHQYSTDRLSPALPSIQHQQGTDQEIQQCSLQGSLRSLSSVISAKDLNTKTSVSNANALSPDVSHNTVPAVSEGEVKNSLLRRTDDRYGSKGMDVEVVDRRDNSGSYFPSTIEVRSTVAKDERYEQVVDNQRKQEQTFDVNVHPDPQGPGGQKLQKDEDYTRESGSRVVPDKWPQSGQDDRTDDYKRRAPPSDYDRQHPRSDSRQEYKDPHHERPHSRQDYANDYDRQGSRSRNNDERRDWPSSRQEYEDRRGRPPSRQARDESRNDRPMSLQSFDDFDRPRSRQDDLYRSGIRRAYEDQQPDRPRSRQGYRDDDPGYRSRYEDQQPDRPRSRQGYRDDDPGYRSRYPADDYYSRSRAQYPDDRHRPRSRQDYPDEHDRDRRRYDEGLSSRRDYVDDPFNRSYSSSVSSSRARPGQKQADEDYQRPRSRQGQC
jgi:hypothetical protein